MLEFRRWVRTIWVQIQNNNCLGEEDKQEQHKEERKRRGHEEERKLI